MSSTSRKEEIEAKRQKLLALRKQREQREQKTGGSGTSYRAVSLMGGLERLSSKEHQRSVSYSRQSFSSLSGHDGATTVMDTLNKDHNSDISVGMVPQQQHNFTKKQLKPQSDKYVDVLVGTDKSIPNEFSQQSFGESSDTRIMYDKSVETEDAKLLQEEMDKEKEQLLVRELKNSINAEYEEKKRLLEDEKKQLLDRLTNVDRDTVLDSFNKSNEEGGEKNFMSLQKMIQDIQQEATDNLQLQKRRLLVQYFEQSLKVLGEEFRHMEVSQVIGVSKGEMNEPGNSTTDVKNSIEDLSMKGDNYLLTQKRCYYNESICRNRKILDIKWSPKSSNIVAVSYSSPDIEGEYALSLTNDDNDFHIFSKSLVCIWDIESNANVPNSIFSAPTEIMCICFNELNDKKIYGGGYNGKIYQWDNLNDDLFPIAVSSNENSHCYPIYCIQHHHYKGEEDVGKTVGSEKVVGTNNGVLVSASTDGTVCTWSPYSLLEPLYKPLNLKTPITILLKYDELAPLCLGFVRQSSKDHMIVGCEDGKIYHVNGYKSLGDNMTGSSSTAHKQYLINEESGIYEGHLDSPVSGMDTLNSIFITSGFDWNIKVWEFGKTLRKEEEEDDDEQRQQNQREGQFMGPRLVVERDDVVMDVKFCCQIENSSETGKTHQGFQFACVCGNGKLEFWDTRFSRTSPEAELVPVFQVDGTTFSGDHGYGLTKLGVSPIRPDQIATGSMGGFLNVFEVSRIVIN